jgi:hypothetical protein
MRKRRIDPEGHHNRDRSRARQRAYRALSHHHEDEFEWLFHRAMLTDGLYPAQAVRTEDDVRCAITDSYPFYLPLEDA